MVGICGYGMKMKGRLLQKGRVPLQRLWRQTALPRMSGCPSSFGRLGSCPTPGSRGGAGGVRRQGGRRQLTPATPRPMSDSHVRCEKSGPGLQGPSYLGLSAHVKAASDLLPRTERPRGCGSLVWKTFVSRAGGTIQMFVLPYVDSFLFFGLGKSILSGCPG